MASVAGRSAPEAAPRRARELPTLTGSARRPFFARTAWSRSPDSGEATRAHEPENVIVVGSRKSSSRIARAVVIVLVVAGILTGCGASSKPAYCSAVTNFKNAVEQLKNVTSPSAVVAQAKKVATTGQAALSAVKTSFATQTSAVRSSLSALETSAGHLLGSNIAAAVATLPGEVRATITSA